VLQLTGSAPEVIPGVIVSLVAPDGSVSSGDPSDWAAGDLQEAQPLDWTHDDGSYFFQDSTLLSPQNWVMRWQLPDGESCDAPFTVT
jgi:hypothetical protein